MGKCEGTQFTWVYSFRFSEISGIQKVSVNMSLFDTVIGNDSRFLSSLDTFCRSQGLSSERIRFTAKFLVSFSEHRPDMVSSVPVGLSFCSYLITESFLMYTVPV